MRILHVGWGFTPWRPGGLIAYAEDLMRAQVDSGHEVAYFFSGRHYPHASGPRLKRWHRSGVAMHEVINSPIPVGLERGTLQPELDVSEPRIEAAFARLLRALRPNVVHIQELLGLPSSLIDIAADEHVPIVMTLQDYQPLCATLRLFDADERRCMRDDVGVDCVTCTAGAPRDPNHLISMTLHHEVKQAENALPPAVELDSWLVRAMIRRIASRAARARRYDEPQGHDNRSLASAFQRRREINVERLGRVDRLIAQSPRLAEIYRTLGVSGDRLSPLPFTLAHISDLRPRSLPEAPERITFATLNSGGHPSKGSTTIVSALRRLREAGLEGRFSLRWLGWVHPDLEPELRRYEGVELVGPYRPDELDTLLDDVDVGLMPSLWEEAFGYAGLEMIAKGIPLIANPLGGIVSYARDGETAWLNRSCDAAGLAELMSRLVGNPQLVVDMHRRLLGVRDQLVTPMAQHISAIEGIYRDLVSSNQASREQPRPAALDPA